MSEKKGTIVIDPGHGGKYTVGDSSPNNATSASGVLEKNITLQMGLLVKDQLKLIANNKGHKLRIIMTRDKDVNMGLANRAKIAKKSKADLFLSIHCNAYNAKARGTETLISPKSSGNSNHASDKAFARLIQNAVFKTIQNHDPKAKNRGVKDQKLGVLSEKSLGKQVLSCLLELEFIDVQAVDNLLNVGPKSPQIRKDIAEAIAIALINAL